MALQGICSRSSGKEGCTHESRALHRLVYWHAALAVTIFKIAAENVVIEWVAALAVRTNVCVTLFSWNSSVADAAGVRAGLLGVAGFFFDTAPLLGIKWTHKQFACGRSGR